MSESFVDTLANGLITETIDNQLKLSSMLILLPTKRSCRALREAFIRYSSGKSLLLPRMRPLGDIDEEELVLFNDNNITLPQAVPELHRRLLLTNLILKINSKHYNNLTPNLEQAIYLAGELGQLIDQIYTEGLDFNNLSDLVPDDYAAHWQITIDFLNILTDHWSAILEENGWIEASLRRNRLIELQAEQWQIKQPNFPILAAGSTGSIPATAHLLSVIACLPQGRLVLPGLDQTMDPISIANIDSTHPQSGLYHMLKLLNLTPDQVILWPGSKVGPRDNLIRETMRPIITTDSWVHLDPVIVKSALPGITRIDCQSLNEEAGTIALIMRETLEKPDRTAALVTRDRDLARRVSSDLHRYGIEINDSAGTPLSLTSIGALLILFAQMVVDNFSIHITLATLKHPLILGGLPSGVFRSRVCQFEQQILRSSIITPSITEIIMTLNSKSELRIWFENLLETIKNFVTLMKKPSASVCDLLNTHISCIERLARDEHQTKTTLWNNDAGKLAINFINDLTQASVNLPPIAPCNYPKLLIALMREIAVHSSCGEAHPRLSIFGPLEARLQHADRLILGGLNEDSWPPSNGSDSWMSISMRKKIGLSLSERRIGLSAHDFSQMFASPEVILTRTTRINGIQTVPSRWLLRLDTVLQATKCTDSLSHGNWKYWQKIRDLPTHFIKSEAPAPAPPRTARPHKLSVTNIETLRRDPYAVYARKILNLYPLNPINTNFSVIDYGNLVHKIFDIFLKTHSHDLLPLNALDELLSLAHKNFTEIMNNTNLMVFWWSRFEKSARWFIDKENERRKYLEKSWSEVNGSLEIILPIGCFQITARVDRIDLMKDGTLIIIDYKTGALPTKIEIEYGFSPQLPIEAVIAKYGSFPGITATDVSKLLYWQLSNDPNEKSFASSTKEIDRLVSTTFSGLKELITLFDNESTPYIACPYRKRAPKFSDYLHLARVKEWSSIEINKK
jgi:ATP-dependent helicase/nuclease subunit B